MSSSLTEKRFRAVFYFEAAYQADNQAKKLKNSGWRERGFFDNSLRMQVFGE